MKLSRTIPKKWSVGRRKERMWQVACLCAALLLIAEITYFLSFH
jgi:hypothetical protein